MQNIDVNILAYQTVFTGLRERRKREKSEERIDCHHQDSNQEPSLEASDALTTELWYSLTVFLLLNLEALHVPRFTILEYHYFY